MSNERQQLGIEGESLACAELEKLGYHIIERSYRSRFGEIDIVADDAGTVVFVEVKTKTNGSFGDPVEEVTPQKQRQIVVDGPGIRHLLLPAQHPLPLRRRGRRPVGEPPKITVYQDAFRPGW